VDAKGKPTEWRAAGQFAGGLAYLYVRDRADESAARAVFEPRLGKGIARIFTREELQARGGDPQAAFALEAPAPTSARA
jgi:hypothetical protein